jgi:hypothetical protein
LVQLTARPADPSEQGDGTLSDAARAALIDGPLPTSEADVAAKAAANRAADALAERRVVAPSDLALAGGVADQRRTPTVLGTGVLGQFDRTAGPSDSTGAVGPTRYLQLVNARFGIYDRAARTPLSSGTLNQLAGVADTVNAFDPQVIWDATMNRFYYAMDGNYSAADHRLLYGSARRRRPTAPPTGASTPSASVPSFPTTPSSATASPSC